MRYDTIECSAVGRGGILCVEMEGIWCVRVGTGMSVRFGGNRVEGWGRGEGGDGAVGESEFRTGPVPVRPNRH